ANITNVPSASRTNVSAGMAPAKLPERTRSGVITACQKPIAAIDAPCSDRRWRAILPENAANLQQARHQWCNDAIPSSGTRSEAVLNKLDDYPIHQTPEPIAHAATSDRNVYDRTWFNGYSGDGAYYFGIGMAIYPHRGILDCAFSVVARDRRQHCFYGSRRAPLERTDMQVGPFRLEVTEPLKRTRV